MIISGVLFETISGRASIIAARLAQIEGIEITGTDGDNHLAAVWRGKDGFTLEEKATELLKSDAEILGIFPTFVGTD